MSDTEQPTVANSGRNPPRKPGERTGAQPAPAPAAAPADTDTDTE